MKRYYDEVVQVQELPQDRHSRLGIENSSPLLRDVNTGEEDQQSYQGNDQEGSTVNEHSKSSLLDTPSMNIRDPQPIEDIPRSNLEACSKSFEKL